MLNREKEIHKSQKKNKKGHRTLNPEEFSNKVRKKALAGSVLWTAAAAAAGRDKIN